MLILLLAGSVAVADDLDVIKAQAEQGDAVSQDQLGVIFAGGKGVRQNFRNANVWFKRAADQGYANAQFHLGLSYQLGLGVNKSIDNALSLLEQAAAQDHAEALRTLGLVYASGRDAAVDYARANTYFKRAAALDDIPAQFYLGVAYQQGRGEQKNDEEAARWFLEAAQGGYANAQFLLGTMYANGHGVPLDLDEAARWVEKAADQGNENARRMLGLIRARAGTNRAKDKQATKIRNQTGEAATNTESGRSSDIADTQSMTEEQRRKAETLQRIRQRQANNNGAGRTVSGIAAQNAPIPVSSGAVTSAVENDQDKGGVLSRLLVLSGLLLLLIAVTWYFRSNRKART